MIYDKNALVWRYVYTAGALFYYELIRNPNRPPPPYMQKQYD